MTVQLKLKSNPRIESIAIAKAAHRKIPSLSVAIAKAAHRKIPSLSVAIAKETHRKIPSHSGKVGESPDGSA